MATPSVLTFDAESRAADFEVWVDDLQLFLQCDRADGLSLFDLTSGASLAPPATADSTTLYDAVVARYSSPATAALSRLFLPYLFPHLTAFPTVTDLITHLRTSDTRYRAALRAEDHFLSVCPTSLTADPLEERLLAAEQSIVAIGASRGDPRTPVFQGCSPPPLLPSVASAAAADLGGFESVGAASAPSGRRRHGKGKGGRGAGGASWGGGGGGGGGSGGGGGGGRRGGGGGGVGSRSGGGGGGGGGGSGGGGGGSGGARRGSTQRSGSGGGSRQEQQRSRETPFSQQLREWYAGRQRGEGAGPCTYVLRTGDRAGEQCGGLHSTQRCFGRLTDSWRHQFPGATEIPRWGDLDEGDFYLCLPPDPGGGAAALGACETAALGASASAAPGAGESALSGTASAQVFHTFTLDSGASRSFFRDRTTLTPLSRPVAVSLADPSGVPVLASFSTVLPCPAAPSGTLSGLYLPSFSTNLVSGADLQDQGVDQFTPASQRVTHCTCARTGRHLATFTRRPGSSLYTLSTESPPVPPSGQDPPVLCCAPPHHFDGGSAQSSLRFLLRPFAAAPHFLWPFAVQYAAHQLNLQPRVSVPETSPTLRWTGKVGDASLFRVWGSRAFVRDLSADKLSPRDVPCDVTFDESVPYYRLFPYRTAPLPPAPLFLAPGPPPVDPLPPQGLAPSGVSQVDAVELVEVAVDSGAGSGGAEPGGAGSKGAEPEGAEPGGAESEGAEPGGAEPGSAESGGAEPGGAGRAAGAGGTTVATCPGGARTGGTEAPGTGGAAAPAGASGAAGAGAAGGVGAGVGPAGGTGAAGPAGVGAAGASGAAGAGANGGVSVGGSTDAGPSAGTGAGAVGAGGAAGTGTAPGCTNAVPAGSGDNARPRPYFVPLLEQVLGLPLSTGPAPPLECPQHVQLQSQLQPVSPLPAPSPYTGPTGGLAERREPSSRPASPVRTASTRRRAPRPRPPAVPGAHQMALRPSTAPLRVPLLSPPVSSLPVLADLASDALCAAIAELVDFAACCRLDYAAGLVAESACVCPPSVGAECALSTDVLEDRQEEFQCFAAALPHLVSMLFAPEGDPDAPDIPTPRSYAEAIEGPYSSQWQSAMDAGTYVDEVPPPGANIVSGMWIFRVKRPPGSPPAFKARYVARGFSQRQGVDYFQTFSSTPKMTTLWVVLHVAAQRDYKLHSLDFSIAILQGSLHEEIWLRRPPGFTGSFPPGTQWSLWRPVYGLRQAPREWHDTLRTTLAALGFAPSTADPSLFLRTDTSLPPFYILVYVNDLVFATADTAGLAHVKSELQKRHTCTDLGELRSYLGLQITRDRAQRTITLTQSHMVQQVLQRFDFTYSSPQATPLSTRHSLSALPSDESVEPMVCLHGCEAEIYAGAMAAQELRWLTYLLTDLGEPPRSRPVLYVDNKAMLALCREHRLEHRTKHIALRYFFARELQQRGQLHLAYVASQANTADIFTKALPSGDHQRFCTMLACFALLDQSCDLLFSPTLPMGHLASQQNPATLFYGVRSFANADVELAASEEPDSYGAREAAPDPPIPVTSSGIPEFIPLADAAPEDVRDVHHTYLVDEQRQPMPMVSDSSIRVNLDEIGGASGDHNDSVNFAGPHREKWREAMDRELAALEKRGTWDLIPIEKTVNKNVLTGKWVFRVKTKADGTYEKHKARWVVRGFYQTHGINYTLTFAPVNRHTSVRLVLCEAAAKNVPLRQIDVSNAFLYADVNAEIYVKYPHTYSTNPPSVCKLKKSLYGIKQAPRLWQQHLNKKLTEVGFRQLPHDPGMYRLDDKGSYALLVAYVDDILYVSSSTSQGDRIEADLKKSLDLTISTKVTQFLGLNVSRTSSVIHLTASKYAESLAKRFNISTDFVATPYRTTLTGHDPDLKNLSAAGLQLYQQQLGCLLFAAVTCRPDLAYVASHLAQFLRCPKEELSLDLQRALRYFVSTPTLGLILNAGKLTDKMYLSGYVDADHAGDTSDRRSRTGYIFRLEPIGPIS
ncbi:unnamed protein product [Closterium sp. NIES-53]